ncbi:unnamed protein product [Polarella glacialis]|uniref:5-oxoprolinase n=1 Tax=Polarella glacialis TaxID=89957 RepID=A0A813EPZ8_POLGL|nr:unnamed protein product [Polarella glacialis]
MSTYLKSAEVELALAGFRCPLLLMTSGGGLVEVNSATALPVRLVESGPAGGVTLAENVAREVSADEVLSLDMGGTTAKLCAVSRGRAAMAREFEVDRAERFMRGSGLPVRIPCLDLVEISDGGGSIASTNAVGMVAVGPQSAGSEPGPACYGKGGLLPTVTDADLVLGRIEPGCFAAGEVHLQPLLAKAALKTAIATPQGLSSDELAAQAVAEAVEESLATAARAHAAEHGLDLSEHVLVAFGGAAPLRAASLAKRLGLRKVLIPPDASVGSAMGFLSAPLAFEALRSRPMCLTDGQFDFGEINAIFRGLWHQTVSVVAAAAARWKPGRPAKERRRAFGRYVGQGREVAIDLPNRDMEPGDAAMLQASFEEAYRCLFFRTVPGTEIEIRTWALQLVADSDPLAWPQERLRDARKRPHCEAIGVENGSCLEKRPKASSTRQLFHAESGVILEVPVHRRHELEEGSQIAGPAIITELYTTTVVTDSFDCVVLENGFLQLETRLEKLTAVCRSPALEGTFASNNNNTNNNSNNKESPEESKRTDSLAWQLAWVSLLAAVEEQAQLLLRAAFSPLVREAGAVGCAIFDFEGRILAQSATSSPGLMGGLASFVQRFLEEAGASCICPGDSWLGNGIWGGSCHASDLVVLTPLVAVGTGLPLGLVGSIAHTTLLDVLFDGSAEMAPTLFRPGAVCEQLLAKLRANSRQPCDCNDNDNSKNNNKKQDCAGDAMALLACNELAALRVLSLLAEHQVDLPELGDHICEASRQAVRRNVKQKCSKGGFWRSEMLSEERAKLIAELGLSDDGDVSLCLDASRVRENSQMSEHRTDTRLGSPRALSLAYAQFALACVFVHGVPINAGSLSALSVSIAPGSLLDAGPACRGADRRLLAHLLPDLVFRCLAQALPDQVPAASASVLCRLDLRSGSGSAVDAVASCHVEGGGLGGCSVQDGFSAAIFPSGLQSTPIEITEASSTGLLFRRKELIPDSGGAGRFRGGLGLRIEVAHSGEEDFSVNFPDSGHFRTGPAGRSGGRPGRQAETCLSDGTKLLPVGLQRVPAGQSLVVETAGGGGFGAPTERSREALRSDLRDGLVSRQAAAQEYGIVDEDLAKLVSD